MEWEWDGGGDSEPGEPGLQPPVQMGRCGPRAEWGRPWCFRNCGKRRGVFCTFPPPISPEDLLLRHPKPRGRRGSVNGGRMRGLPSATVGKALSSSPMLLRRVFASLPRLDVVCSYPLAGVTPVRLSGPPGGGNRLAFRRECLGSCLMASSCRTEGARRSPYVPLPPPTADKVGVLFLFR